MAHKQKQNPLNIGMCDSKVLVIHGPCRSSIAKEILKMKKKKAYPHLIFNPSLSSTHFYQPPSLKPNFGNVRAP